MKTSVLKNKGQQTTYFMDRDFQEFDRELCMILFQHKWLFAHTLKFNERIIAANFDFRYNGHVYCHEITYDIDFDSKFSPGRLLQYLEIEKSYLKGCYDFDLGQGDVWYKRQWCNSQRKTFRYYIFNDNPIIRRIYLKKLKPILRTLYLKYFRGLGLLN
jgi:CelD/BcsL family acetyltransferase involved in cellulose biosynthesis